MPRPSIGETAMTDAERQARYRAARAAGRPVIRTRRPADRRSRIQRWNDALAALAASQAEYAAWLEALRAICDIDLAELQAVEPPRGFGRD